MADDLKDMVIRKNRRFVISSFLEKGTRLDGRKKDEVRSIQVEKDILQNTEGSAIASIGNTKVLAATKFDMSEPYPDSPKSGNLICDAQFLQLAHPSFEGGPPGENAIELARVVDRGVRHSTAINLEDLFIEDGKVLALFIDLYVLDNDGNLIDAAGIAASAALACTKMPKVEDGKILRDEIVGELKVNKEMLPVPTTFVKIGKEWIIDPNWDEEFVSDTKITITTAGNYVCGMQKSHGKLSKDELISNIKFSMDISKDIRNKLW